MIAAAAAAFVLLLFPAVLAAGCYSSIFSFGDSLADNGNLLHIDGNHSAGFACLPYGMTYFGRPTGRFSDGRLILDFIAEALGLPLLPAYLDQRRVGGDFEQGANFAVAGATALDSSFFKERDIHNDFTNVSLGVEIRWFRQLLPSLCSSPSDCADTLQDSLIMMGEIGGNDYIYPIFQRRSLEEVKSFVPFVVATISSAVTELIELGARTLVVPGITPLGCHSAFLTEFQTQNVDDYDAGTGCLNWLNEFSTYHNSLLEAELQTLRGLHPHATIVYADYFAAIISILNNPNQFGFGNDTLVSCCGGGGVYNYNPRIECGSDGYSLCDEPSRCVIWDGLHMTEATHRIIAGGLLQGPFASPAIADACGLQSVVHSSTSRIVS
ncbi:GDSL esterase/lipase At1g28590-like isoform X2 [Zingiber officinale]|uniref:GDSL esterase/lipase At1g28590-like isoform X2 n=1 Tax=Zingiber officinale TaxID=94328 RepID=UPI001C4BA7F0|nr:GDSL esterase/lipase At1g28590-like isoform X2 [Zingiber officinale]